MSLSQDVQNAVDKIVSDFIRQIAHKYNLDVNRLLSDWSGEETTDAPTTEHDNETEKVTAHNSATRGELSKMKKPELQALCREGGLKCSGTKPELIDILLAGNKPSVTQKKAPVEKVPEKLQTPIATKLASQIPTIAIRRNQFGNHEHPETGLVFNKITKKVNGKQNDDGSIEDLTPAHIDMCNKHKFDYELPENLEQKTSLDDVEVDELEEEEVIDSDDERVEEEELMEEEFEEGI